MLGPHLLCQPLLHRLVRPYAQTPNPVPTDRTSPSPVSWPRRGSSFLSTLDLQIVMYRITEITMLSACNYYNIIFQLYINNKNSTTTRTTKTSLVSPMSWHLPGKEVWGKECPPRAENGTRERAGNSRAEITIAFLTVLTFQAVLCASLLLEGCNKLNITDVKPQALP